jgi:hypothetical protein
MTDERIARNEAVFREANERIRDAADRYDIRERVPFVCECAAETCTEILRLSLTEYEHVRSHPTWFVNAPGHHAPFAPAVQLVEERDGYVVAEKVGRAAEVAEELDPRTPQT